MKRVLAAMVVFCLASVAGASVSCKGKPHAIYCHPTQGEIDAGDPYATVCGDTEMCGKYASGYRCCNPGRDPGCQDAARH